jgi:glycosyltransferase involved in cell wall biosynthesis
VVFPFRDARPFISDALESLGAQTMDDFEVVMVDDSSGDGSSADAEEAARRDGRFRLVRARGAGLVDALNTGLEDSTGKWIARFDADDLCMPGRLEAQLALAERTGEHSVVSCRVRSFPDGEITDGYREYCDWINSLTDHAEIERGIFIESPVPHPTAFFSRRCILEEGAYAGGGLPEDYELWLRLWSRGYTFHRVPEVLVEWRERPDRLSRMSPVYSLTRFYRLKASYLRHVPALSEGRILVAGSGQTARRLAGFLLREGFEIGAFIDPDPGGGRKLRGIEVGGPEVLDGHAGWPVLVASRAPGARERICAFLEQRGLRNWLDYVVCA